MQQNLVLPPTVEPVSVKQALCHLREDEDAQHDLIDALITTARQYIEDYTRRSLVRQTWEATASQFPACIELPTLPVKSVSSVTYVDSDGTSQTLAASTYQVDTKTEDRTLIVPAFGEVWPSTQPQTLDAVTVQYISGYAVPFTVTTGSDANQCDAVAHPFANGDVFQVWNTGGELPSGISQRTNYYVVNAATDSFELATSSGGAAVSMTTDGEGDHFAGTIPGPLISALLLLVGHLYENREMTAIGALTEIPLGVSSLLLPYASVRFG